MRKLPPPRFFAKILICLAIISVISIGFNSCKKETTDKTPKTVEQEIVTKKKPGTPGTFRMPIYCGDLANPCSDPACAQYYNCPVDSINYYTQIFLFDPAFQIVVDKFGNNSFDIVSQIHATGGFPLLNTYNNLIHSYNNYSEIEQFYLQNNLDTFQMLDKKAEIFASILYLYKNHPGFSNLSQGNQISVITNVFNSLGDPTFRSYNSSSPVVSAYNALLNRLGVSNTPSSRLTPSEAEDCLRDAIIGTIASATNLIKQLISVINSYNLGWSGIFNVSKSALRTIVGSNLIGGIVGFALCIAWEYFF